MTLSHFPMYFSITGTTDLKVQIFLEVNFKQFLGSIDLKIFNHISFILYIIHFICLTFLNGSRRNQNAIQKLLKTKPDLKNPMKK